MVVRKVRGLYILIGAHGFHFYDKMNRSNQAASAARELEAHTRNLPLPPTLRLMYTVRFLHII
jgi:hypothetical protein